MEHHNQLTILSKSINTVHLTKSLFLGLVCTSQIYSASASEILIQDLGTLRTDNSGSSYAYAVSADGKVVVGSAYTDAGSQQAFRHNEGDSRMTGLGSLKADNSGYSEARAVSADGKVVVGWASTDAGVSQAFRHAEGDSEMTGLGSLRTDNSGSSYAYAVSADGKVVVGEAENDAGVYQAFRHAEGDSGMTGLGSLRTDNSGSSYAYAVSADGKVVVGWASTDAGYTQTFRHTEGANKMTGLGSLKTDNSGSSYARAVSADGRVVVGWADTDAGTQQAFRHNEGDSRMTGLGSLRTDNSGYSSARAVSADGKVVVGSASTDTVISQAFRHNEGDSEMTGLGSLRTDNSGSSYAYAVSADGKVVVGTAENDAGVSQAFRHNEGDSGMTGLGSLRTDNSGSSYAYAVSADGKVVVGQAYTDAGLSRAVVWKTTKAVDLDHTIDSMLTSTALARQVLGVYEGQLFSLADQNCTLDSRKNYCIGAYTNYNNVKNSDLYASGLIGALRIKNTGWTIGGAINFNLSDDLVKGYDAHGFELPGLGAFIRYHQNMNGSGLISELRGSYLKQKMTITREALSGAENGQGETKLNGYLIDLGLGYGLKTSEKWLVTPKFNIRHYDISRDAYDENRNADFLASYSEMGNRNTDLSFSVNSKYMVSPKVNLVAEIGSYITLNNDQKDAAVKIDYVGQYQEATLSTDHDNFRPFVRLASNFVVSPNSVLGVHASWHKTTYTQDFTQAGLVYSYRW